MDTLVEALRSTQSAKRRSAAKKQCARAPQENVREAAALARSHKYRKWQPL